MIDFLSVDTIFFTVLDYPMSYIEFIGTLCYLVSVWLITKRHMLTWPIGIISVLLFMALFYQIRLYADALEQIYYLGASIYGWWYWSATQSEKRIITDVHFSSYRALSVWIIITIVMSITLGAAMTNVHIWFPRIFPESASFPYLDALTTIMSLIAMWLMARKKIESWLYWIIVDIIGIMLYYSKGIKFIALLYVLLLMLAVKGFMEWQKAKSQHE